LLNNKSLTRPLPWRSVDPVMDVQSGT
jgi:hypothetical protein